MTLSTSTVLRDARRIVVKVGSSLVTNEGRGLDEQAIGEWCRQLSALVRDGREVIMVSSGALTLFSVPPVLVFVAHFQTPFLSSTQRRGF